MDGELLELNVKDTTQSSFREVVANACLDFPKTTQIFSRVLRVSGWVLQKKSSTTISNVLVRNGDSQHLIALDVMRPDVLVKVLGVSEELVKSHALLKCGFSKDIEINMEHGTQVYFVSNGVEYLWKEIGYSASLIDIKGFDVFWETFLKDDPSKEDIKILNDFLAAVGVDVANNLVFKGVNTFSPNNFLSADASSLKVSEKRFFDYLMHPDFCVRALETICSNGAVVIPDPFSYGFSTCRKSYTVAGNVNILKFKSGSGEVFFVFQHVSSADAIFFPARKSVVTIKHLPLQSIRSAMALLIKDFKDVARTGSGDCIGVIASHGRPYHFYYDVAPAINDLNEAGLLSKVKRIFYYEGGDFCSFKSVYNLGAVEQTLSPVELSSLQRKQSGYYFHVGALFDESRIVNAIGFDHKLVAHSRASYEFSRDADLARMSKCYPVIWFGVTVQKRSWIEQVDAAVSIFKRLHEDYPTLGIVFDGWTSPLIPTAGDRRETANDLSVCKEISEQLPSSIEVFNVVGAVSTKKVVYSRFVDAYIGNSATGGLHIDRFGGRPGVGHLNTKLIDSSEHIRKNTVLVNKSSIKDRPEDMSLRIDFISYSIDWRVIYDEVLNILQGRASM